MAKRTRRTRAPPGFPQRQIEVSSSGDCITRNGGMQLLRLADRRNGLIKAEDRRRAVQQELCP